MGLTEKKIKVYRIAVDMLAKLLLTLALIVAFFIVLYFLINAQGATDIGKFGALEAVLASTFYLVVRHHFPTKKDKADESAEE